LNLLKWVDSGIPLPLGAVKNIRSFIYLENLADALAVAVRHPGAKGQSFLVSDGHDVSTRQLISDMAAAMGKPLRLWSVPIGFLLFLGALCGKRDAVLRLTGSLRADCSSIKERLGWRPPYHMAQGLQDTIRWYRS
jgi:nucleoside-diphosphate-sugar epimerase